MAGYRSISATNTACLSESDLLYCKTNIGGFFFDGFITVNHSMSLKITKNPVETGSSIVDHSYVEPASIRMKILMSDVHESLVPGQFEGSWSRSVKAWEILKKIQSDRIPVSVLTRLGLYENMLIESISADDSSDTYNGLSATVNLVEIPVARVRTVKISAAPQTTVGTEMGKVEAESLKTVLYQIMNGYYTSVS